MGYSGGSLAPLFDPELAHEATQNMAETGGDWLFERIVAGTPVSYHGLALVYGGYGHERDRVPGTLKASWRRMPVERISDTADNGFAVRTITRDPVAPYVENDTVPHVITPKKPGGLLRWRAWPTGEVVYARLVHHPGTRGAHMVAFAVHAATLQFDEIVDRPLHDWAEEAAARAERQPKG